MTREVKKMTPGRGLWKLQDQPCLRWRPTWRWVLLQLKMKEEAQVHLGEAKRILEHSIRKEKRGEKLELARIPLMATPNLKRSRPDLDNVWDTPPPPSGQESPRTPARAGRRLQTPIQAFLVSQTLEERKKTLESKLRTDKLKEMSASPKHRHNSKRLIKPAKRHAVTKNIAWLLLRGYLKCMLEQGFNALIIDE